MCLTLAALLKKVSAPQDSVLGRLPGTDTLVDADQNPEAEAIPGLLIFRPNGLLFFANANRVRNRVREAIQNAGRPIKRVVLTMEASPEIDATSLDMLEQLRSELVENGTELAFARVQDPVRDLFRRSGFLERLGESNVYWSLHAAVDPNTVGRSVSQTTQPAH
jgi:MFS superfamily sulfate permease-like transporter